MRISCVVAAPVGSRTGGRGAVGIALYAFFPRPRTNYHIRFGRVQSGADLRFHSVALSCDEDGAPCRCKSSALPPFVHDNRSPRKCDGTRKAATASESKSCSAPAKRAEKSNAQQLCTRARRARATA